MTTQTLDEQFTELFINAAKTEDSEAIFEALHDSLEHAIMHAKRNYGYDSDNMNRLADFSERISFLGWEK